MPATCGIAPLEGLQLVCDADSAALCDRPLAGGQPAPPSAAPTVALSSPPRHYCFVFSFAPRPPRSEDPHAPHALLRHSRPSMRAASVFYISAADRSKALQVMARTCFKRE
jgi:hypothetical protein